MSPSSPTQAYNVLIHSFYNFIIDQNSLTDHRTSIITMEVSIKLVFSVYEVITFQLVYEKTK